MRDSARASVNRSEADPVSPIYEPIPEFNLFLNETYSGKKPLSILKNRSNAML
jgi:hypothetical protein